MVFSNISTVLFGSVEWWECHSNQYSFEGYSEFSTLALSWVYILVWTDICHTILFSYQTQNHVKYKLTVISFLHDCAQRRFSTFISYQWYIITKWKPFQKCQLLTWNLWPVHPSEKETEWGGSVSIEIRGCRVPGFWLGVTNAVFYQWNLLIKWNHGSKSFFSMVWFAW